MDFKEWLTQGFLEVGAVSNAGRRNDVPHQYSAEGPLELYYIRIVVPPSSSCYLVEQELVIL